MPAGLESDDTMFSVRERPWHGLGTIVQECLTAEEALVEAGLDFQVIKRPLYFPAEVKEGRVLRMEKAPDMVGLVRDTDLKVLGYSSPDYQVIQPREGFEFIDTLVDSDDAKYETAGSLWGGKRIWILARVPQGVKIAGEDHEVFILFTNAFTAKEALGAYVTIVRVVCQNTLNLAIANALRSYRIRHRGDVEGKLAEARNVLGVTFTYSEQFQVMANDLLQIKLSDQQMATMVKTLIQIPEDASDKMRKSRTAVRSAIAHTYLSSDNLNDIRGTGWGFVNAVAEYSDWVRPVKKERWGRILRDTSLKQHALDLTLAQVN